MFERENAIGWLLLATCAVAGGVLVWSMVTETTLVYTGPDWLPPVLGIGYLAAVAFLWFGRPRKR